MACREIMVIASDAGGTMTDMIAVDRDGNFVLGKASTTPADESIGYFESLADALRSWDIDYGQESNEVSGGLSAAIYTGTSMLNVLLTRAGRKIGLLVTRGHEDILLHERGQGAFAGYSYQDRLHKVTHCHNKPLVPRRLVRGITEATTVLGEVFIPVYEHEVVQAVNELIDRNVEGIVICFIHSYLNPHNEHETAQLAQQVAAERGVEVALYLSSQVCPIMREVSRLNSTLLQAYASEPAKENLLRIEGKLHANGYRYPLQIVLAAGGIANIRYPRLHEAAFSGPIGGLLGGQFISRLLDAPNILCTDLGGTSFDVGLIRQGLPMIQREVEIAHLMFNIPTLVMDSVGTGCGQYVKVDPERKRLSVGPESAGADPGPVCYGKGNTIPTVMDCALVTGILNPGYYLGGKCKLDKRLAYQALEGSCASVMGVSVYDFAEGVLNFVGSALRDHVQTVLSVRGFTSTDYLLLMYGGAGPMFMAAATEGLHFKGVVTVPFAAAFSAFGSCVTDFVHRYQKSTLIEIPAGADDSTKARSGEMLNRGWAELEREAIRDLKAEGFDEREIVLQQLVYLRYGGQLEDLEVVSPISRINSPVDLDELIVAFETLYAKVYAAAARFSHAGYLILEQGLAAVAPKAKPNMKKHPLEGKSPPADAFKGRREVYRRGSWQAFDLYEMDLLRPGNEVKGPAIIEHPATTLVVPPDRSIALDQWKVIWMKQQQA